MRLKDSMAYTENITILVDTREQKPLSWSPYKDVNQEVRTLKQGDYTAILHTRYGDILSRLVFDRKSVGDLWGTFVGDSERFKNEYHRSVVAKEKLCLIVEATCKDIHDDGFGYTQKGRGFIRHNFTGSSMIKKMETFREKYSLEVIYCDGRTDMRRYIASRFMAQLRLCNSLLNEFKKTGEWDIIERLNKKVFIWA